MITHKSAMDEMKSSISGKTFLILQSCVHISLWMIYDVTGLFGALWGYPGIQHHGQLTGCCGMFSKMANLSSEKPSEVGGL